MNTTTMNNCNTCKHQDVQLDDWPCQPCCEDNSLPYYPHWEPIELKNQYIGLTAERYIESVGKDVDIINDPLHYKGNKLEVIDVIKDFELDFIEGNVIKYVLRYSKKNGKQDLLKAKRYLEMLIAECKD